VDGVGVAVKAERPARFPIHDEVLEELGVLDVLGLLRTTTLSLTGRSLLRDSCVDGELASRWRSAEPFQSLGCLKSTAPIFSMVLYSMAIQFGFAATSVSRTFFSTSCRPVHCCRRHIDRAKITSFISGTTLTCLPTRRAVLKMMPQLSAVPL